MKHIFGRKQGQSGFSLVELMIVVGIIGVLATLALPRFKQFQAKAKLAEAGNILSHIYTLEQSYSLDNNTFLAFALVGAGDAPAGSNACAYTATTHGALGFTIDPCVASAPTPRFAYATTLDTTGGFIAQARTYDGANNRICAGNTAFSVYLTDKNAGTYQVATTAGPGNKAGQPKIGEVCIN